MIASGPSRRAGGYYWDNASEEDPSPPGTPWARQALTIRTEGRLADVVALGVGDRGYPVA